jgi:hypothetical protein
LTHSERPNVLSVIAVLKTADNKLILNHHASGDWEESYELVGGFVRMGTTSLISSINTFLEKDLGIKQTDIKQQTLNSIGHYVGILETMAIFKVELKLTAAELLMRGNNSETIQTIDIKVNPNENIKKATASLVMHPPTAAVLRYIFE